MIDRIQMRVEPKPGILPKSAYSCDLATYQQFAYTWAELEHKENWEEIHTKKGVTNPPEVYKFKIAYVSTPHFCEDGKYVCPLEFISDACLGSIQTRVMIGVVMPLEDDLRGG